VLDIVFILIARILGKTGYDYFNAHEYKKKSKLK